MLRKPLAHLSQMLKTREISSEELCGLYIDRINSQDKTINSFAHFNAEKVIAEAKESDKRRASGDELSDYDGIPVAVKDNICTRGTCTTCGSKILEGFISPYNATSYQKLLDRGFVLMGKTNMDEFAMGSTTETSCYGVTKNPHDHARVPGGSSGGSASAVCAGESPVALGSDTGGSIRQPAAFCGVVGIKPTYGRVSRYGLVAFASSLDQIGPFANNVDDAALVLSLISGHDPVDSTSLDGEIDFLPSADNISVKGMKIGVPPEYFQGVSEAVKTSIEKQIQLLKENGAQIQEISLKYTEYAIPAYYLIATAEASSNLARFDGIRYGYRPDDASNLMDLYRKARSRGFGSEVKRRIILGTFALSSGYYDAYYLKALKVRSMIMQDFKEAFRKVDVILSPTTTTTASKLGELINDPLQMYMSDILTISANLAGIPGISIPVGYDENSLPVGLQLMGPHFGEKAVLSVAAAVEKYAAFKGLD